MSDVKQQPYTPEAVRALLQSFEESAGLALLFLKNVKSISTYIKRPGGSVDLLQKIAVQSEV